jgi:hypothetical protein
MGKTVGANGGKAVIPVDAALPPIFKVFIDSNNFPIKMPLASPVMRSQHKIPQAVLSYDVIQGYKPLRALVRKKAAPSGP